MQSGLVNAGILTHNFFDAVSRQRSLCATVLLYLSGDVSSENAIRRLFHFRSDRWWTDSVSALTHLDTVSIIYATLSRIRPRLCLPAPCAKTFAKFLDGSRGIEDQQ